MLSASASSHRATSCDTLRLASVSAGDGGGCRGCSPVVLTNASIAVVVTCVQLVYVTLPNATMPTPWSGSHSMIEPNPGRPPVCETTCLKAHDCDTRNPYAQPPELSCSAPFAVRVTNAAAGRHTC